ncbi:YtoQ family protein [Motiliproteus coralliicola]|uniref:YtoQ family protein n=1 Tax=Motiliproteus coralliicola TaxID=2283196 RepID=A0A369WPC8_9GAMM|nr:YtoQ family protein [Motiliproteus coralliicola]RDE23073.1 YtoQ family protein [Motiliproteus coralliicola]
MSYTVYLSGEIHSQWREEIKQGIQVLGLDILVLSPVTDHDASDAAGDVLGEEADNFWRDHKSSKVNLIRTQHMIDRADLAVIRFGDKYRQWNAAFDAGYCAALRTPYITLHSDELIHPLKEVDASAMAWAQTTDQVISLLQYILQD